MNLLNHIMTALFGVLMAPFERLPPLATLLVWSVITGITMALVFRFTSNQRALVAVADQTRANVLAIKLFQDDLGVTLRCLLALLGVVARRLWHSLPPMVVLIVPLSLLLAQLGLRFEHAPLQADESAIVELRLSPDSWNQHQNVAIQVPASVNVETPPMRDSVEHTIYWRISSHHPTSFDVGWDLGDETIEKKIAVAERPTSLIPVGTKRPGRNWFEQLLHPAESAFPSSSPARAVVVHHRARITSVLNFNIPWWGTFLIVSCLSAWLLKPIVKVQF